MLNNQKRYEEAIICFNKAIEIDSEYSLSYQNKAWAYYQMGDLINAEAELDIALKLDGNNEEVLLLKIYILDKMGSYEQALIVCDRIL